MNGKAEIKQVLLIFPKSNIYGGVDTNSHINLIWDCIERAAELLGRPVYGTSWVFCNSKGRTLYHNFELCNQVVAQYAGASCCPTHSTVEKDGKKAVIRFYDGVVMLHEFCIQALSKGNRQRILFTSSHSSDPT